MEKKQYSSWQQVPLLPGEKDNHASRMRRWEVANNRKFSQMSRQEWIQTAAPLLAMTPWEAEEYLGAMISKQM